MMFLLHCNSCFSALFFLLCQDFFHFILHVCFLGRKTGIESGTAYLLTEDEAGGEEIDARLYPQGTELWQNVGKGCTHAADAKESSYTKGGWEYPSHALPKGRNIGLWPGDARHEEQWNGGEDHQEHHILTVSYQAGEHQAEEDAR